MRNKMQSISSKTFDSNSYDDNRYAKPAYESESINLKVSMNNCKKNIVSESQIDREIRFTVS